jgi:polyketide synthase 13
VTKEQMVDWITVWLAKNIELDKASIALDSTFVKLGVDSIHAMMLVGDLEEQLNTRLSPTLAWDHPTVQSLAAHLVQNGSETTTKVNAVTDPLANIDQLTEQEIDALLESKRAKPETP